MRFSDNREITSVLTQYGLDVTQEKIMEMYNACVDVEFGFLKIDIYNPKPKFKYSKGFNDFCFL